MAQCPSCTQEDLDNLGIGQTLQCGNYTTGGTYLGTTKITKTPSGWLYDNKVFVPTTGLDLCADPLDISGGLGE